MPNAMPLVTADELLRMGSDCRHELVDGRLQPMSPVAPKHGNIVATFITLLGQHVKGQRLGSVGTEVGFTVSTNPDTVFAPDVSFIRGDRIPSAGFAHGFWKGAPDLAVEVLSPDDRESEMRTRTAIYLKAGVRAVVVIDPDDETVTVHRRLASATLSCDDSLDLGDVVSGFSCCVRDIFD